MNKFSINLWNWVNGLGPECAGLPAKIKNFGFTALELPMTQAKLPEELKKEVLDTGLAVSICAAMGPGRDLSSFDESVRKNTEKYILQCLRTGQALGAKVFCGPLYAGGSKRHCLPAEEEKREWELAVTELRKLAPAARDCGILLALEPINRYRTSVVNTAHQVLKMVDDIGADNVGVHFDTYQACLEETDFLGALETVLRKKKLFHLHAVSNNRGAPGQGLIPWKEVFTLLKTYGYEGHITMETFAPGGLDAGWVKLADNQDDVARQGIEYLRSVKELQ